MDLLGPALSLATLALAILTVFLGPRYMVGRVRTGLEGVQKDLVQATLMAQQERARLAGTIGTLDRRVRANPAAAATVPGAAPIAAAVAQAATAGGEIEVDVPDWLVNAAKGAGVDVGKVLAGDPAEIAKARAVMGGIKAEIPGRGGSAPGQGTSSWAV